MSWISQDAFGAVPGTETIQSVLSTLSDADERGCPLRAGSGVIPPVFFSIWKRGRHQENMEEIEILGGGSWFPLLNGEGGP